MQWTPPVNYLQELTSDRSVVPWSDNGSPAIGTSPLYSASPEAGVTFVATQTPSRKQRISLPKRKQTPMATAIRKKICFSLSVDFSTAEKGMP